MRGSLAQRADAKIDRNGPGGCWLWTGALNSGGYGSFSVDGRARSAHVVMYELFVGPVPNGLELDHLCRVRHCVNPDHLEPVTRRENIIRGMRPVIQRALTHCCRGHEFDEANTYRYAGSRHCRACARLHQRAHRAKARR